MEQGLNSIIFKKRGKKKKKIKGMSLSSNYWPLFLMVFMLVYDHVGLSYLWGKKKRGVHAYFLQRLFLLTYFTI